MGSHYHVLWELPVKAQVGEPVHWIPTLAPLVVIPCPLVSLLGLAKVVLLPLPPLTDHRVVGRC